MYTTTIHLPKREEINHHPVWNEVKFLKKHNENGTTVDQKYTHVCLTRITVEKGGQEGPDEDEEGNWIKVSYRSVSGLTGTGSSR